MCCLKIADLSCADELRRALEGMSDEQQESMTYYGRWALGMAEILQEKGLLTLDDLEKELGGPEKEVQLSA